MVETDRIAEIEERFRLEGPGVMGDDIRYLLDRVREIQHLANLYQTDYQVGVIERRKRDARIANLKTDLATAREEASAAKNWAENTNELESQLDKAREEIERLKEGHEKMLIEIGKKLHEKKVDHLRIRNADLKNGLREADKYAKEQYVAYDDKIKDLEADLEVANEYANLRVKELMDEGDKCDQLRAKVKELGAEVERLKSQSSLRLDEAMSAICRQRDEAMRETDKAEAQRDRYCTDRDALLLVAKAAYKSQCYERGSSYCQVWGAIDTLPDLLRQALAQSEEVEMSKRDEEILGILEGKDPGEQLRLLQDIREVAGEYQQLMHGEIDRDEVVNVNKRLHESLTAYDKWVSTQEEVDA